MKSAEELLTQADIFKRRGQYQEARAVYMEVMSRLMSLPNSDGKTGYIGLTTFAIALTYRDQEDYENAIEWMKKCFQVFSTIPNLSARVVPDLGDIYATYSDTLAEAGRLDEADEPLIEAIKIFDEQMEHIDELDDEDAQIRLRKQRCVLEVNWTELKFKQRKFAEAEDRARVVANQLQELNPEGIDHLLLKHLIRFSSILWRIGKDEEAEQIEQKLLSYKEREEGKRAPNMAQFLYYYAKSYFQAEKYDRAANFVTRARDIYERVDAFSYQEEIKNCQELMDQLTPQLTP